MFGVGTIGNAHQMIWLILKHSPWSMYWLLRDYQYVRYVRQFLKNLRVLGIDTAPDSDDVVRAYALLERD